MDFSRGFNIKYLLVVHGLYQLATLFGIGKIPGGGTWASLVVLIIALYEQNAAAVSFLAFFSLIIGPLAYKRLMLDQQSLADKKFFLTQTQLFSIPYSSFIKEDPKEFVLDEVIGMGIAISGVYIFSTVIDGFSFNILSDYTTLSDTSNLFILTFILFRFFDISKIGPVGWVERNPKQKGYIRVIGDDIMAALLSIIVVIIFLSVNLWMLQ